MNIVRRTIELDADTDTRLRELVAERGQDVGAVLAEALALLDSVVDIGNRDIEEKADKAPFKGVRKEK